MHVVLSASMVPLHCVHSELETSKLLPGAQGVHVILSD